MSILGTIMSSILGGRAQPAPPPGAMSAGTSAPEATSARPQAKAAVVAPTPPQAKESQPPQAADQLEASKPQPLPGAHATSPPSTVQGQVDVAAVLDNLSEETDEELDWRRSIVDLMKLLKLDSSLSARKALAKELNYAGDTKDSAAMNVWLHKQVMAKLAEGGGKLPPDVRH